jgi:hypothetical protein
VLGALTGEAGFTGAQVGKITVTDSVTYVAVERRIAHEAQRRLAEGKVKGRSVKVRILEVDGDAPAREFVPAVRRRDGWQGRFAPVTLPTVWVAAIPL